MRVLTSAFVIKPLKTAGHHDTTLCRPYGALGAVESNTRGPPPPPPAPPKKSFHDREEHRLSFCSAIFDVIKTWTCRSSTRAPAPRRGTSSSRPQPFLAVVSLAARVVANLSPLTWQPLRARVGWPLLKCFCRPWWRQLPSSSWGNLTDPRLEASFFSSPRSQRGPSPP